MSITKYGLLSFLLVTIFTVAAFGGHFGYAVNGVPKVGYSDNQPGILGALEWVWDSLSFLWDMMSFQVDGMPEFISGFFIIISLMVLALILWLIRGG